MNRFLICGEHLGTNDPVSPDFIKDEKKCRPKIDTDVEKLGLVEGSPLVENMSNAVGALPFDLSERDDNDVFYVFSTMEDFEGKGRQMNELQLDETEANYLEMVWWKKMPRRLLQFVTRIWRRLLS